MNYTPTGPSVDVRHLMCAQYARKRLYKCSLSRKEEIVFEFLSHRARSLFAQALVPVRRSESARVCRPGRSTGFSYSSSDQSVGEVHRCCEYRDEATRATVAAAAYPVAGHGIGHGPVHVQRDFNESSGTVSLVLLLLQLYN